MRSAGAARAAERTRPARIRDVGGGLWAVTAYFNPRGYRSRLGNYRRFRDALSLPLVTAELSRDGSFELGPGDAEILVRVHGGDVLWQKERLLNVALGRLPDSCQVVAWLDADVVFPDDRWPGLLAAALRKASVVQLYRECVSLGRDGGLPAAGAARELSFASLLAGGAASAELLLVSWETAQPRAYEPTGLGKAWAMRRADLERHGFYDACILGGGDRALVCAAAGEFESAAAFFRLDAVRTRHYLEWALPFHDTVRGRIGHVDTGLLHLWHGEPGDRMYFRRHAALARVGFDPYRDVAIGEDGAWRWAGAGAELRELCASFFADRRDDGRSPGAAASSPPLTAGSRSPRISR